MKRWSIIEHDNDANWLKVVFSLLSKITGILPLKFKIPTVSNELHQKRAMPKTEKSTNEHFHMIQLYFLRKVFKNSIIKKIKLTGILNETKSHKQILIITHPYIHSHILQNNFKNKICL